jgi:hypothetical protein
MELDDDGVGGQRRSWRMSMRESWKEAEGLEADSTSVGEMDATMLVRSWRAAQARRDAVAE